MNQVANRTAASSALAGLTGLKQNLQNVQTSIVSIGGDYLMRMLKDGVWVYGAENIEVEKNSEWAVNPLSVMHGWVAWTDYKKKKNEILAEVMVPCSQPLPAYDSLREVKDDQGEVCEYSQQIAFQLQCLTGEDTGEQVRYKATSLGGMNASKELLGAIVEQLDKDMENPVPVIVLGSDSYNHKTYGKTYVPVFEIVDWVPLDAAIKPPMEDPKEEPDADVKQPETQAAGASRTRVRGGGEAKPDTVGISDADRRAAIDAAMHETAQTRAGTRAAAAEEAAPGRTRRRR